MASQGTPAAMKRIFGIFMILVYLGMGILMFCDFFYWMPTWTSLCLGSLFIVYGIWRGYREIKK